MNANTPMAMTNNRSPQKPFCKESKENSNECEIKKLITIANPLAKRPSKNTIKKMPCFRSNNQMTDLTINI